MNNQDLEFYETEYSFKKNYNEVFDYDDATEKNINFYINYAKSLKKTSVLLTIIIIIGCIIFGISQNNELAFFIIPILVILEIPTYFLYSRSLENKALLLYQTYQINKNLTNKTNEKKK